MRLTSLKLNSLQDLFVEDLKDLYGAEQQIIEALPKMIEAAHSEQLKNKFQQHLIETQQQARRLEEIFSMLDMEPEAGPCEGMRGIIKEGQIFISAEGDVNVKDAALIGAAQKVEHYEVAGYGTACTFAQVLGHHEIAQKLQTTLGQEKETDKILTQVAESSVNPSASM